MKTINYERAVELFSQGLPVWITVECNCVTECNCEVGSKTDIDPDQGDELEDLMGRDEYFEE